MKPRDIVHVWRKVLWVVSICVSIPVMTYAAGVATTPDITSIDTSSSVRTNITPLEKKVRQLQKQLQDILAHPIVSTSTSPRIVTNPMAVDPGQKAADPLCLELSRTLSVGSFGDDVLNLQNTLASDSTLYPEGTASGYFGLLTRQAVMRLQDAYGLYASGDTTASGVVGPITRGFFHDRCMGVPVTTAVTSPGASNTSTSTMQNNQSTHHIATFSFPTTYDVSNKPDTTVVTRFLSTPGTQAKLAPEVEQIWFHPAVATATTSATQSATSTPATSSAPTVQNTIVTGFYGPKLLSVGQTGTWIINDIDPSGVSPFYAIDWGDVYTSPHDALWAMINGIFTQKVAPAQFTHAYTTPGVYTFNMLIKNAGGAFTRVTDSVAVIATTTSTTTTSGSAYTGVQIPPPSLTDMTSYASSTALFGGLLSCEALSCHFQFANGVSTTFSAGTFRQ